MPRPLCPKCGKPYTDMVARTDGHVAYMHGLEGVCMVPPKEEPKADTRKSLLPLRKSQLEPERQPIMRHDEDLLVMAQCLNNCEKLHQEFLWLTEKDMRHLAITMYIQKMNVRRR